MGCAGRLGGGEFSRYEGPHQIWRFPLAARPGVCAALQSAQARPPCCSEAW